MAALLLGSVQEIGALAQPDGLGREPWDAAVALAFVGGDRALLCELLAIFVADGPVHLGTLRDAITHADAAELTRIAHMLKGELRTLGAPTAAALAEQLEDLGSAPDVDVEGALTLYASFERELHALFARVTSQEWA